MVEKVTYSVQEASKILGIGYSKMYQMVRANEVPNIKLGKRYLIPIEKFKVWVNKIAVGGLA